MNDQPLVSVICLCHNQADYVAGAIQSVLDQDYPKVELIVVDDASRDGSKEVITDLANEFNFEFISLEENVGNCKAFNQGFNLSKGSYIIDLAADDLLVSNRISQGLTSFNTNNIGVNFCDALLLDERGKELGTHYKRDASGHLLQPVLQGDIYVELISTYFISPPTMMIKREVLEDLKGYDENLSYEDFDFWIRSSRNWDYGFIDQILVKKRMLKNSHSSKQFQFQTKHQKSTLAVCRKIQQLNQSKKEQTALKKRCWYEVRQCIKQGNLRLVPHFIKLMS